MKNQLKILILGYGEMGHAIEFLLQDRYHLDIWDKYPKDNFQPVSLEDTATTADVVFFCLPVNPHYEIAQHIAPLIKPACLCLSIAKGLDEEGRTAAQIFAEVFSKQQPFGFLYGPMISEEICAGHYAFAQVACNKTKSYATVKNMFEGTRLFTEETSDITGISWAVILKNVYALIFGIADELQFGDNARGFLMVNALDELDSIAVKMGGHARSPYHLAGLGDLITTATSENSHHHELGRKLAREETEGITGEGIHTLEMVSKYNLINTENYPLFDLIKSIVSKPQDIHNKFNAYLRKKYIS